MYIIRKIMICVTAFMLFACASSHSVGAGNKEPKRFYATIETHKYTIIQQIIDPMGAYFEVNKEYEVYVESSLYGGVDKKRDDSVRPAGASLRNKNDLYPLNDKNEYDPRLQCTLYSANDNRLEFTVQPAPGWMIVPSNGKFQVEGYSPIVTNYVLQNFKLDNVHLHYTSDAYKSHTGGGWVKSKVLHSLKIVKNSPDSLCKVAADVIERDYIVRVKLNPEDAISRVLIKGADLRLTPTTDKLGDIVRNLVPADQVDALMKMIYTGHVKYEYYHYECKLLKNVKYKIQIRHPDYQFTETTFTVPDHNDSTINFLIGDKGSKVRVVFE